mmetsp:Transcript_26763/g.58762  ORF Transcript_26763/g.58762 Transcript_26763/m.58762 type:complete len:379 (+) Transcript_26763:343-1479(+)|eukprot:5030856-Pleurochrysis_carterae.AAC.5
MATTTQPNVEYSLHSFDKWKRIMERRQVRAGTPSTTESPEHQPCQARKGLPSTLKLLLLGAADPSSLLFVFAGCTELLVHIYRLVRECALDSIKRDGVYTATLLNISFPQPRGACCNMMPIMLPNAVCGSMPSDEWKSTIPTRYKQYIPLIEACPLMEADGGKIGYLTVHESRIEEDGQSQRRPGLHTESPGLLQLTGSGAGGEFTEPVYEGGTFLWGGGHHVQRKCGDERSFCLRGNFEGGIYMASTVGQSCRVWNAKVTDSSCIGRNGDIEHLRDVLGEGSMVGANELVWMTDMTPHESLPLPKGTYRQYFRLVTSNVSAWYSRHSTENELGIFPPSSVRIIDSDKFAADGSLTDRHSQNELHHLCDSLHSAVVGE